MGKKRRWQAIALPSNLDNLNTQKRPRIRGAFRQLSFVNRQLITGHLDRGLDGRVDDVCRHLSNRAVHQTKERL